MTCFKAVGCFTISEQYFFKAPSEEPRKVHKPIIKSTNGPLDLPSRGFDGIVAQTIASRQLSATFSNMMRYFHKNKGDFSWEPGEETVFHAKVEI